MIDAALRWCRRHEAPLAGLATLAFTALWAALYMPLLPGPLNSLAPDYELWLTDLLAGEYWILHNGLWALPWFSPFQCGGVPFFADPQVPYLSLTQALTLAVPPMAAVQATILLAAAAGFAGTYALARLVFRMRIVWAGVAAALFLFNQFFAARMLVGHLPYYTFMLLPVLWLAVLPWPGRPVRGWPGQVLRAGLAGLLMAAMVEAGMSQIVLTMALATAMAMLLAGVVGAADWPALGRGAAAVVVGAALSAGKLAGSLALLAQFPRDQYELPVIDGVLHLLRVTARLLFLGPWDNALDALYQTPLSALHTSKMDQHEFYYAMTPVPLLLLAAAALLWLWQEPRGIVPWLWRRLPWLAALALVCLVPLAGNLHQPALAALWKSLPLVRNSSTLLRWFAAYIPLLALAAPLALDRQTRGAFAPNAGYAAGVALVLLLGLTASLDLSYFEDLAFGPDPFPPARIDAAWARARATGEVPPITAMSGLNRIEFGDTMVQGQSPLWCYWPMFGYFLEAMPMGSMHVGDALQPFRGRLNVRNPACDLFPRQNACAPGDQFPADRRADAQAFLDYRPFPFARPWWMEAAPWLGSATALALAAALAWAAARLLSRPARRRP